ncbi:MAG: hypothetical protein HQK75_08280 [Candidatus Magnetomorum sp.]|nr:hypothetical protein [Candidatus Magnetomorum sp.]
MQGSIIGSFRKYYQEVLAFIQKMEKAGITILSPQKSSIVDPEVDFVIFESDNPDHCYEEIQLIALHRILRSDFVYVCNPNGYIGRTTCYEIGRVVERNIPLYFSEAPVDLPIYLPNNAVISNKDFIDYYARYKKLPVHNGSMSTAFAEQLNKDLFLGQYYD